MTRAKPPPTLFTAEAISKGRRGRADGSRSANGGIPPTDELTDPNSPSRPSPISTDLDTAPTVSDSPRPPAFTIGTIPIYHTPEGDNSSPPSDGNESGTMLGSSTISSDTIVHIQPGGNSYSIILLAGVQKRAGKVAAANKPHPQMMHLGEICMPLLKSAGPHGVIYTPPSLKFGEIMIH